jgi:glycosyltransferase involved in cell wall biosynthesis
LINCVQSKGLVSTVIPVYNRAIFLHEAVLSVLNQNYKPIEVILVDDGSTDGTSQTISELVDSSPGLVRSLRITNSGPGGAREQGRLAARGEFIQYLDSDDRLLPNKFADQIEAFHRSPECGVAYGKTRLIDEDGKVLVAPFKMSGERMETLFPALLVDRWWNTHTPLYRREICDAVGPWSTMRMGEDWLYDAKIGALGTKLAYCDTYVSEHRQHSHERLTGKALSASALRDFGRLIPELFFCAQQAGVKVGSVEMQHFSRWAFSLARQLGRSGEVGFARRCFEVARQADRDHGTGLQFQIYSTLAKIVGWKFAGLLSEIGRQCLKRPVSNETLKQSWMR